MMISNDFRHDFLAAMFVSGVFGLGLGLALGGAAVVLGRRSCISEKQKKNPPYPKTERVQAAWSAPAVGTDVCGCAQADTQEKRAALASSDKKQFISQVTDVQSGTTWNYLFKPRCHGRRLTWPIDRREIVDKAMKASNERLRVAMEQAKAQGRAIAEARLIDERLMARFKAFRAQEEDKILAPFMRQETK